MFYVEDNGDLTSTQYSLVIAKPTSVWLTLTPSPSQSTSEPPTPLDMTVLVVRSKPDKHGNSVVTFTERRDSSGVSKAHVNVTGNVNIANHFPKYSSDKSCHAIVRLENLK